MPAPATLDILKGIPIEHTDVRGELTTPTGAGIVAVLAETFGTLPAMKVTDIGYGAGTKTFADRPERAAGSYRGTGWTGVKHI